jgi:beta-glucanase (GH16 family)
MYEKTHAEYTHRESLANDFHTYGLIWKEDRIMTYIDDEKNKVLDVAIDKSFWEFGDFPEGMSNPWKGEPNNAPFN